MAELALWKASGVDIDRARGQWYKSVGQGTGAALNATSAINAYVLSDRATWIHFRTGARCESSSRVISARWLPCHLCVCAQAIDELS